MTSKSKNFQTYKSYHIWSWTLRIFHWTFAISIIILIFTGLIINNPPVLSSFTVEKANFFLF